MRHERLFALVLGLAVFASAAGAQISPGPLSAAHASLDGPLNCTKCHSGGSGGAGMTNRCLACHKEIGWLTAQNRGFHARAGKGECASCHPDHAGKNFALIKWPDGSRERFDHAKTGWALDDKHARVTCDKCHAPELRVSQSATLGPKRSSTGWIGLETSCASCHEDVHAGSLGRECANCHTAAGWSPASQFDHARSDYPLTGKHADVVCGKCHTRPAPRTGDLKPAVAQFKPVAHKDCASCHRDPHAGRLRGTCESCHTTTGFNTVNESAFSHDRTRFALRGRHASVACVSCHAGYPARIDRPAFTTCAGCHADPHAGKATLAGATVDCASCHAVAGFAPSTFTVAQHAQTAYPLQGQHATVACSRCHQHGPATGSATGRGAKVDVVMHPDASRCESCHAPAHADQLAGRSDRGACASCHTPGGWKPAMFGVREHSVLRFALTGRHATADCGACHSAKRPGLPPFAATRTLGTANVALTLTETTCESCHRDPHAGKYDAIAPSAQGTCAGCHDTRSFHPSALNPNLHAKFAFALEGAHRAVPCVSCHTTMKGESLGASLKLSPSVGAPRVYTLAGASCAGCHNTPHGNQFASRPDHGACESCHGMEGWAPAARFNHAANGGFVLGAAHEKVACGRCHTAAGGTPASRTWHGVPRACESCHRGTARSG